MGSAMRFATRAIVFFQAAELVNAVSLLSLTGVIGLAGLRAAAGEDVCAVMGANNMCKKWISGNVQRFTRDDGGLEFKWQPCDEDMREADFGELSEVKSMYQTIIFEESVENLDKCLTLDDQFQQCTTFRPHYHEPAVHFPAAYLKDMRRVVFVGGGDSMILHEVLKYPTVELVLGLELDQKVVRQSFKYFNTQPHFDDERVQWWFGDGAKTITMLPREYFGTFDLVLLDLSETVMSLSVTKNLDIFRAMSLLLKPDGILVKNDFGYFEKLSKVFKYALQLDWPDIPYICNQEFVFVSQGTDFLKPNLKLMEEYKPETLLYKPLEDINDHFEPITDYSNNAESSGQCQSTEEPTDDESDDERARSGILLVVEAENAAGPLQPVTEVEKTLLSALKSAGLTPLSAVSHPSAKSGATSVIALREGYVVAHTWPEHKYCALDIQLWAKFGMLEKARSALLDAVGSSGERSWSSFRIVVGGMLGTETWNEDKHTIGPDLSLQTNCDNDAKDSSSEEKLPMDEETIGIVFEEGLKLLKNEVLAAVLCGDRTQDRCAAIDALKNHKSVQKQVTAIWTCPADGSDVSDGDKSDDGVVHVSLCGQDVKSVLLAAAETYEGLNAIVVDPSAPTAVVNQAHQFWIDDDDEEDENEDGDLIRDGAVFMVPILDESDTERVSFLKYRDNNLKTDPDYRVELNLDSPKNRMKLGLVVPGTPESFQRVVEMANSIEERSSVKTEVRKITIGGAIRDMDDYDAHSFAMDDYDQRPGREQFFKQQPLGRQTIYQLRAQDETDGQFTAGQLKDALEYALSEMAVTVSGTHEFTEVGDGSLLIGAFSEGHAIVVWDGGMRVDINLFTYDEGVDHENGFVSSFVEKLPTKMSFLLRDEQPRGIGRVINFSDELDVDGTVDCFDEFEVCEEFGAKGLCEEDNQKEKKEDKESSDDDDDDEDEGTEWVRKHCKHTCGLCGDSVTSKTTHTEL